MRHTILILLILEMTVGILCGCKTSEENYRKVYEVAKQKKAETDSLNASGTIYDRVRNQGFSTRAVAGGDTLSVRQEYVAEPENIPHQEYDPMWNYGVVAGQFRQLFHARSMAQRLRDAGYTHAFIVQTREPVYYVVAEGAQQLDAIIPTFKRLQQEPPFPLSAPAPWILKRL